MAPQRRSHNGLPRDLTPTCCLYTPQFIQKHANIVMKFLGALRGRAPLTDSCSHLTVQLRGAQGCCEPAQAGASTAAVAAVDPN